MACVRHRVRDDIQRELVKTKLASEHESAEWMILSANCPPFLESLRLTQFTLGNKAPRVDKVRTFPGP
jgi:Ca2+-dependent lipid-binding protein